MMRLIVNGDDLGLNERCSLAIVRALAAGRITDTTMMANGAFFDGAVGLVSENSLADRVGIHFNLTEGEPLTEAIREIPDFVADGRFHKGYLSAPRPLNAAEREAVYTELTAQVLRMRRAGLAITHADSHHYIHNLPSLAPTVARVCREQGIGKVRLCRNLGGAAGCEENNRFWRENGFLTADYFGRTSDLSAGDIRDRTEIMVHPDLDRGGVLIDRRGWEDGFPVGKPLPDVRALYGAVPMSYSELL